LSFIAGFLAIFCRSRGIVIAAIVLGTIAMIIAIVGAAADGTAYDIVSSINACTSQSSSNASPFDYGSDSHYEDSRYCLERAGTSAVPDMCYCSTSGTFFSFFDSCDEYTVSATARAAGKDCGVLFTTYPSLLQGSMAINSLISIFSLVMAIIACVVTCKKRDGLLIEDKHPNVGVFGGDA
jgi:hypothetical protein